MQKNQFKKISQNVPLSKQVEEQLKEAILKKVYVAGERLPNELKLVEMFGVSRTAIREALSLLAGQGLVKSNGRYGVYVSEMEIPDIVNPFILLLKQKCGDGSHLYLKQVRRMIEPEVARLAAENCNDEDIAFLEETIHKMEKTKDDPPQMIKPDIQFHRRLVNITNNPIIPIIMEPIFILLPEFISENFKLSVAPEISIKQHKEILLQIKNHNKDKAFDAMMEHMKTAEKHVLQHYKEIGFEIY